ncbi:hypothetical protein Tco_1247132 [Tanacetum coccineum]
MANISEDIQCAGSDTRPPMLDKTDFASWQQRIRLYCRGKENGVFILKSIDEGPFQMGTFRETLSEGNEDKDRYNADIRATNILLQGLPKDIYSLINHYIDAKDIWENVKMLLEGLELTKEDRESQLYDDFKHFRQHKGKTIHDYYVRFAKLINNMRNINMTMSRMQLNSKFVNNMLPECGRFVTTVKLNRGLRESNYDQLYAYLKQHEAHTNEKKMMLDRFTQHTVDPLALMSNVAPQQYNSQSSTNPSSIYVPPHFADNSQLDSGLSPTNNLIENLTNTLALLTQSYKTYLPQTNNQLKTSLNPRYGWLWGSSEQSGMTTPCEDGGNEQTCSGFSTHVDNVFLLITVLAFDSDVVEAPTAQTMFLSKSIICRSVYDAVGLSYVRDIYSENIVVDNSLTTELETDKEQVKLYERRARFELTEREQKIDEQLRIVITDRNIKEEKLKKEHHSVKLQLASTINHNKSMVKDRLYKQDQSLQTVHMLCKPKPYYNESNKVAIGYKNPLCLTHAKQVQPALYNGYEIVKNNHVPAIVHNIEDTLEIAEIT